MKIIQGFSRLKDYRRPVVALGVFDGVHRAHRRILKDVVSSAARIKGTSMVITFSPHPQKENSIYSLKHRLRLIEQLAVDVCVVVNFNKDFALIPADRFVKDILVDKIGIRQICVGRNFRFGRGLRGNYKTLEEYSRTYGFKVKFYQTKKIDNIVISSTSIRRLISQGKLDFASKMLSQRVSVLGTVVRGASLGRILGFPTANINPHHEILPPAGVYAVKIQLEEKRLNGICYIGTRPTFNKKDVRPGARQEKYVEAHIFNFRRNIYARDLEIEFIGKIRQERKFANSQSLSTQIKKDVAAAKKLLSRHS